MSTKTGTKEWAKKNINIDDGCPYDCRYCYARHNQCNRFKRIKPGNWINPVRRQKAVEKNYRKVENDSSYEYDIMFPSCHDITSSNIADYITVLRKLLEAGNSVLIVSKPTWSCISYICDDFIVRGHTDQVCFRFTIGTYDNEILKFWEPNAPCYLDRVDSLKYAYRQGYETSVSCEPFLHNDIIRLYSTLLPWITESFWIGKMKGIRQRVNMSTISKSQYKQYIEPLHKSITDESILNLYESMKDKHLVRWKDSIKAVLEKQSV